MARYTTTLVLLLAVLGLGGYIALVERRTEHQDQRQERARRALRFDADRVTALRISTPSLNVALDKEGTAWSLTSPVRARANVGEVGRILDTLEALVRSEVITGRQQREQHLTPQDFGFATPRARITLRENGRDMTLLIGREAPLGGDMFIKLESEASILVASTNLLGILPASPADLRERQVFLGLPGEATRLDVRRAEGLLQLARADQGGWRLQKPFTGRAAYAAVQELLDKVYEMRVIDFVADSIAAAPLYGLDEPTAQITLAGPQSRGEQILRLGRTVEGRTNEVYAMLDGAEHVFTVQAEVLDALAVKAADLRDRRLLTLPAYDIAFIRTIEGERAITLARAEDNIWTVTEPRQFTASEERLQNLLSEWTGLRIETFIDNPGTNLAQWGLSPPARRITLARRPPPPAGTATPAPTPTPAPSPEDSITVLVAREDQSSPNLILVKLEHEDTLYQVSRDALEAIPMQPLFYREQTVLTVAPDDVLSLTRTVAGVEQSVERNAPTNAFRTATGARMDEAAVSQVLAALRQVRAADFVVEDPESLTPWGLAEPRATLTLGLTGAGGLGKVLAIGDDAGPDTVFAWVRGKGLIFTLKRTDRDILLAPLYLTNPEPVPRAEPDASKSSSGP